MSSIFPSLNSLFSLSRTYVYDLRVCDFLLPFFYFLIFVLPSVRLSSTLSCNCFYFCCHISYFQESPVIFSQMQYFLSGKPVTHTGSKQVVQNRL